MLVFGPQISYSGCKPSHGQEIYNWVYGKTLLCNHITEYSDGAVKFFFTRCGLLPACASEQGNVIGSVRIYI